MKFKNIIIAIIIFFIFNSCFHNPFLKTSLNNLNKSSSSTLNILYEPDLSDDPPANWTKWQEHGVTTGNTFLCSGGNAIITAEANGDGQAGYGYWYYNNGFTSTWTTDIKISFKFISTQGTKPEGALRFGLYKDSSHYILVQKRFTDSDYPYLDYLGVGVWTPDNTNDFSVSSNSNVELIFTSSNTISLSIDGSTLVTWSGGDLSLLGNPTLHFCSITETTVGAGTRGYTITDLKVISLK